MNQNTSQRKSNKGIVVFIILLIILIVIGVLAYFLFFKGPKTLPRPVPSVQPYSFSGQAHTFSITSNEDLPSFQSVIVDPLNSSAGTIQKIALIAREGENYIVSAQAIVTDDIGNKPIDLSLSSRTSDNIVTWQGEWTINAVQNRDYVITFVILDKNSSSKQIDIVWTGQASNVVSLKTFDSFLDKIKDFFSIPQAKAEFINTASSINSGQFPHGKETTVNSTIALGPGTPEIPFITGIDGGNIIISYAKTLELKPYTYFVINPGYQMINQGGSLATSILGSGVIPGYLWAKDTDNDKCFDRNTIRYNSDANSPDTSWGSGYKRLYTLSYFADPDDNNPGTAPSCIGSSYNLKITKTGTGNGMIVSDVGGLGCGSICEVGFSAGTTVRISVQAEDPGSNFIEWSGACTGTGDCIVTMNSDKEVIASFDTSGASIEVVKSGTGNGTVKSAPTGLDCGEVCTSSFPLNSSVTLTATADASSTFINWTGNCTGTSKTCTINSIKEDKEVEAKFNLKTPTTPVTKYEMVVTKNGSGEVNSTNITGIVCGSDCTNNYTAGREVVLRATPSAGYSLTSWGGACAGTTGNTCTLIMNQPKNVTVNFTASTMYVLNVSVSGVGSVTSYPTGISCGAYLNDCTHEYISGLNVTLTAVAGSGSSFIGWSGACSGTGNCTIAMNQAKNVIANFSSSANTITVAKAGTGTGTVTGIGIDCGSDCSQSYQTNTLISLTASPFVGSTFVGWSGVNCTGNPCTFNVTSSQTVTALFIGGTNNYPLIVSKTGNGTVMSNPTGIDCGTTCNVNLTANSQVTLLATPSTGYTFTGWTGDCTGTNAICNLTMSSTKIVGASFTSPTTQYQLNVLRTGSGSGTVTSNSPTANGISCGGDCSENYSAGVQVILTQQASQDSDFKGWFGGYCFGTGSCTVTMDQAKTVTAQFDLKNTTASYTLVVSSGNGTVMSSPAGINCTGALPCSQSYADGTSVILVATPADGYTFTSWSGDCTGTSPTCALSMTTSRAVAATFTATGSGDATSTVKTLTVAKTGDSFGYVKSATGDIDCGDEFFSVVKHEDCTETYSDTTSVTLTATKGLGAVFSGWGGACTGTGTTCTVNVDSAKNVTAGFNSDEVFTITVNKAGTGKGTASGGGTYCNATCQTDSYQLVKGSSVTMYADPSSDSAFIGWSGDCSGTTCAFTLTKNMTVTATFSPVGKVGLTECSSAVTSPGVWVKHTATNWGTNTMCEVNSKCKHIPVLCLLPGAPSLITKIGGSVRAATFIGNLCIGIAVPSKFDICVEEPSSQEAWEDLPACPFTGTAGTVYAKGANCNWTDKCEVGTTCSKGCGIIGGVETTGSSVKCSMYACNLCMIGGLGGNPIAGTFYSLLVGTGSGTGSGTVTASADIDCSLVDGKIVCEAEVAADVAIELTAQADSGSIFKKWEGCDNVSGNKCTVTPKGDMGVQAVFDKSDGGGTTTKSITVDKTGTGSGTVTSSPSGIDCGSTCTKVFPDTTTSVTLTATASSGSTFFKWTGCTTSSGNVCHVTITGAHSVTVQFNSSSSTYTLTANKSGTGTGTIVGGSGQISCLSSCTSDTGTFSSGSTIIVSANPSVGSTFAGWSGACSGTNSSCTLTMNSNKSVTATFTSTQTVYNLQVTVSGSGDAFPENSVFGCSNSCTYPYTSGEVAKFIAYPDSGASFTGWTGCTSTSGTTCTVNMTSAKSITAKFTTASPIINKPSCGPVTSCTSSSSCGYFSGKEGLHMDCSSGTTYVSHSCIPMANNHIESSTHTSTSAFCSTYCGATSNSAICVKTDGCMSIQCK